MNKITVAGNIYRVGRLDAMKQLHVARRLVPVLAIMGVTAARLSQALDEKQLDDFLPMLGPISDVISKMSDVDVDFIIYTCLAVVEREVGDRAGPVVAGTRLMYEDMDMPTILRLTVEVAKDNLGGFLKGLGVETA